uniref:Uncharacterized protein n=1 Tax=Arundo donax TaxID=35708 RepID=A0A0A8ZLJ3_ARUDO
MPSDKLFDLLIGACMLTA